MMKCDGCPMRFDDGPCTFFTAVPLGVAVEDFCHLTPDQFPIIRAMIEGKWKCEECGKRDRACLAMGCNLPAVPCQWWEEE